MSPCQHMSQGMNVFFVQILQYKDTCHSSNTTCRAFDGKAKFNITYQITTVATSHIYCVQVINPHQEFSNTVY